jgi:N utilization substance protein A
VQQIDKGNILVNLGRTEALLPFKEQIRKERYRQGDSIRGCILDVKSNPKGPQVIMSRTSPMFLERLFEIEVPEIFEKIVKIVKIVRAPGYRAKVAVTTSDSRVDPVGACVGMRGNRVQAIVRELSNERMDIINWTEEINTQSRRVFAPSEIKRVIPVGQKRVVVIVSDTDLAQAIGKEGQNIKLASKLIDKEIDIYGESEFAEFTEEQRENILSKTPVALEPKTETPVQEAQDAPVALEPKTETPAQEAQEAPVAGDVPEETTIVESDSATQEQAEASTDASSIVAEDKKDELTQENI